MYPLGVLLWTHRRTTHFPVYAGLTAVPAVGAALFLGTATTLLAAALALGLVVAVSVPALFLTTGPTRNVLAAIAVGSVLFVYARPRLHSDYCESFRDRPHAVVRSNR